MRVSSFLLSRAPTEQEVKETDAMVVGSGWQRVYLMGLPSGGPQFYESAIANGAIDEGAPGIRENYNANYYGAFVRDLDGNKIEAVTFTARETFECRQVGDANHLQVFDSEASAEAWFRENDPEGVAFEYEVQTNC